MDSPYQLILPVSLADPSKLKYSVGLAHMSKGSAALFTAHPAILELRGFEPVIFTFVYDSLFVI
jgi:hypothetical protein